ncbi:hypothetical protein IC620_00665 [Hazenella sp. IB182357]|uniref:Spore coat protein n=1 Tax=Polycladospora coralii TaxID=2771432 RepID=A0A926RSX1_9BACL|nr:hypothetical protein [Polycladospora coralii]MBD1370873.1 hypothetical protein [Polycladospora coralii]MBS7529812.1 hypothetical protein [Polycladospora coralii]
MQITSKDLNYLADELSWEMLAMKKCAHYANECQDTEVKQMIDSVGQMHQQHYITLLQQLQSATGGLMATMQQQNSPNHTYTQ